MQWIIIGYNREFVYGRSQNPNSLTAEMQECEF